MIAEKTSIRTPSAVQATQTQSLQSWATEQCARPMVRQSRESVSGSFEATTGSDETALEDLPWADRRLEERRPPRPGASVEIRRWGVGSGADFAVQLLDLSHQGVRVQLNRKVGSGERFEVILWSPNREWCIRCMGVVRWCLLGVDGLILSGLRLSRPIAPRDYGVLVGPVVG